MTPNKLNTVQLRKDTTCLTYALQRAGIDIPELTDTASIEEYFDKIPLDGEDTLRNLPVGTILLFCNAELTTLVPRLITDTGKIISQPTLILRHVGVYEGNMLISEAGINSKNFSFCIHVRSRNFLDCEMKDRPNYFLKLKA